MTKVIIGLILLIAVLINIITSTREALEGLQDEVTYSNAMRDTNTTRIQNFEANKTEIERVYNERVYDINSTPVGTIITH